MRQVEQQPRPADQVVSIGNVLRGLDIHLRLRRPEPFLVDDQALLQLADAGEILIKLIAVVGAKLRSKRRGLITNVIEDAAALFEVLQLGPYFTVAPLKKHRGK